MKPKIFKKLQRIFLIFLLLSSIIEMTKIISIIIHKKAIMKTVHQVEAKNYIKGDKVEP